MADTIRQKIINVIYDRLNDYAWTAVEDPAVFHGRSVFDPSTEAEELPLFTVLSGPEEATRTKYGTDDITFPVSISCLMLLEQDQNCDDICEPVFGEMKVALFAGGPLTIDEGDPSYVDDNEMSFEYRGGGVAEYPAELGPAIITITISAVVGYESPAGNPYI